MAANPTAMASNLTTMNVCIGLIKWDQSQQSKTIDERLAYLAQGVHELHTHMGPNDSTDDSMKDSKSETTNSQSPTILKVKGICLAPEYYFQDPNASIPNATSSRACSRDDRIKIWKYLEQLSDSYQNILIVPGTIFWRDQLDENVNCTKRAEATNVLEKYSKFIRRHDAGVDPIQEAVQRATVLAQTSSSSLQISPLMKKKLQSERTSLDSKLKAIGKANYVAYNESLMFYAGAFIYGYQKKTDFTEVLGGSTSSTVYIPGTFDPIFPWENISCGIEICGDHDLGVLNTCSQSVNIHIILSDWVAVIEQHITLKPNGLLIHASTNPVQNIVSKYTNNVFSPLTEAFDKENIKIYEASV